MARWHLSLKKLLPEISIKILFGGSQRTEKSKTYFWHGLADCLWICFCFSFLFLVKTDDDAAGYEIFALISFYLLNIQIHC